ncbi:MAG: carbon monoxide dehydrogenase subunit G [Sporichthyaceae bacterium]|nr:carbon monoxide dehydrogenase subunit G [Sporichthyaceae bacterium]
MKVTGTATLSAPREHVWAALRDPAVLVRTIPGCEQLVAIGPDEYRMTVSAGVAAIKGQYQGTVLLTDLDEPGSFIMRARGAGGPGMVDATVQVRLDAEGPDQTLLSYDADAVVGGMIGGVGHRVLTGVSKRMAGEFFTAVNDVLTGRAPQPAVVPSGAGVPGGLPAGAGPGYGLAGGTEPAAAGVGAGPVPVGAVFTAPGAAERTSGGLGWSLVLAAVIGALIALTGVLVGWTLAR